MQRLYMMGVVEVKTLVGGSATAEKRPRAIISQPHSVLRSLRSA
jgi:hypothetical protein